MGNWPMAESVFKEIVARCRRGQRGYTMPLEREATYNLGVALQALGRLDEALQDFYRCDELSRVADKNGAFRLHGDGESEDRQYL